MISTEYYKKFIDITDKDEVLLVMKVGTNQNLNFAAITHKDGVDGNNPMLYSLMCLAMGLITLAGKASSLIQQIGSRVIQAANAEEEVEEHFVEDLLDKVMEKTGGADPRPDRKRFVRRPDKAGA